MAQRDARGISLDETLQKKREPRHMAWLAGGLVWGLHAGLRPGRAPCRLAGRCMAAGSLLSRAFCAGLPPPPPTHPTPLSPLLPAVNLPRPPTAYNLFTNAHIHQARQGLGPAPAGSEIMLRLSGGWQPGRAGPGQLCWPPRACRRPIAASGAAGRLTRPHYVHPAQRCGGLPPSWRSLSSSWRRRRSCERPPGSPALPCPALLRLLACHARGGKRVR